MLWYVEGMVYNGSLRVHSDIVSSRRFTLFPLFDCLPSGRQPTLFGQPSLEFETGRIGHGGPFLGWHGGPYCDLVALFRSAWCRYGDMVAHLSIDIVKLFASPVFVQLNLVVCQLV